MGRLLEGLRRRRQGRGPQSSLRPRITTSETFRPPMSIYETLAPTPPRRSPQRSHPRAWDPNYIGPSESVNPPSRMFSDYVRRHNLDEEGAFSALERLTQGAEAKEARQKSLEWASTRLTQNVPKPQWMEDRIEAEIQRRTAQRPFSVDSERLANDPSVQASPFASDILQRATQEQGNIEAEVRNDIRSWLNPSSLSIAELEDLQEWGTDEVGFGLQFTPQEGRSVGEEQERRYLTDPFFKELIDRTGGHQRGLHRTPQSTAEEDLADPIIKDMMANLPQQHGPEEPEQPERPSFFEGGRGALKAATDLYRLGLPGTTPEEQAELRSSFNVSSFDKLRRDIYDNVKEIEADPLTEAEMARLPLGDPRRRRGDDDPRRGYVGAATNELSDLISDVSIKLASGAWTVANSLAVLPAFVGLDSKLAKDFRNYGDFRRSLMAERLSDDQKEADHLLQSSENFGALVKSTLTSRAGWRGAIGMAVESLPFMFAAAGTGAAARGASALLGKAIGRGVVSPSVIASMPMSLIKNIELTERFILGGFGEGLISAGAALDDMSRANGGQITQRHINHALATGVGVSVLGAVSNRLSRRWGVDDFDDLQTLTNRIKSGEIESGFLARDLAVVAARRARQNMQNTKGPLNLGLEDTPLKRTARVARLAGSASGMEGVEELGQSIWEQMVINAEEGKDYFHKTSEAGFLGLVTGAISAGAPGLARNAVPEVIEGLTEAARNPDASREGEAEAGFISRLMSELGMWNLDRYSGDNNLLDEIDIDSQARQSYINRLNRFHNVSDLQLQGDQNEEQSARKFREAVTGQPDLDDRELTLRERQQAALYEIEQRMSNWNELSEAAENEDQRQAWSAALTVEQSSLRIAQNELEKVELPNTPTLPDRTIVVHNDDDADSRWREAHGDTPRPVSNVTNAFTYQNESNQVVSVVPSEEYFNELKERNNLEVSYEDVVSHEAAMESADALIENNVEVAEEILQAAENGQGNVVSPNTIEYYNQLLSDETLQLSRDELMREVVAHEMSRRALARSREGHAIEDAPPDTDPVHVEREKSATEKIIEAATTVGEVIPGVKTATETVVAGAEKVGEVAKKAAQTKVGQAATTAARKTRDLVAPVEKGIAGIFDVPNWKWIRRGGTGLDRARLPESLIRREDGQSVDTVDQLKEGEIVTFGGRRATVVKRETRKEGYSVTVDRSRKEARTAYFLDLTPDVSEPADVSSDIPGHVQSEVPVATRATELQFEDGSGEVLIVGWDPSLTRLNEAKVDDTIELESSVTTVEIDGEKKSSFRKIAGVVEDIDIGKDRDGFRYLAATIRNPDTGKTFTVLADEMSSVATGRDADRANEAREGLVGEFITGLQASQLVRLASAILTAMHPGDDLPHYPRILNQQGAAGSVDHHIYSVNQITIPIRMYEKFVQFIDDNYQGTDRAKILSRLKPVEENGTPVQTPTTVTLDFNEIDLGFVTGSSTPAAMDIDTPFQQLLAFAAAINEGRPDVWMPGEGRHRTLRELMGREVTDEDRADASVLIQSMNESSHRLSRGEMMIGTEAFQGDPDPDTGRMKDGDPQLLAALISHELGHVIDWMSNRTIKRQEPILEKIRGLSGLKKYLEKRNIEREGKIRDEVVELSRMWRPFDREAAKDPSLSDEERQKIQKYVDYRDTASELFADAMSALLTKPGLVETIAPTFFKDFFTYLDTRPVLRDKYFEMQLFMGSTEDTPSLNLLDQEGRLSDENFELAHKDIGMTDKRALDIWRAIKTGRALNELEVPFWSKENINYRFMKAANVVSWVRKALIDRHSPIQRKVRVVVKDLKSKGRTLNESINPTYLLAQIPYIGARVKEYMQGNFQRMAMNLAGADISWQTFGTVILYTRVASGARSGMASPGALTQDEAVLALKRFRQRLRKEPIRVSVNSEVPVELRPDNFKHDPRMMDREKVLDRELQRFNEATWSVVKQSYEEGLMNKETYEALEANRKKGHFYATFRSLYHLGEDVTASVEKQEGMLEPIQNPATATMMKMAVTLRKIELNNVKRNTMTFIQTYFPEDVGLPTQDEITAEDRYKPVQARAKLKAGKAQKNRHLVTWRQDGRTEARYVEKYIAESLNQQPAQYNNLILRLLKNFNSRLFRPMFTVMNPGFMAINLWRDFWRFYKAMSHGRRGILKQMGLRADNPEYKDRNVSLGKAIRLYFGAAHRLARTRAFGRKEYRGFKFFGKNIKLGRLSQRQRKQSEQAWKNLADAHKIMAFGITYNDQMMGKDDDHTLEQEYLQKFGIDLNEASGQRKFWSRKNFGAMRDFIKKTGDYIETLPKAAALTHLASFEGGDISRLTKKEAQFIRAQVGSPDFLSGGTMTAWSNELFLFSNAMIQGWRGDWHTATDPETRGGYLTKMIGAQVLPKFLMMMAYSGILGGSDEDDDEEGLSTMMRQIPSYDLMNYFILPLWRGEQSGMPLYLRIPLSDTDRVLTGVMWTIFQNYMNKPDAEFLGQIADYREDVTGENTLTRLMDGLAYGASFAFMFAGDNVPTITPTIKALGDTFDYISYLGDKGRPGPYDAFRGQPVLSNSERSEGPDGLKKGSTHRVFLEYMWNQLGGGIIHRFRRQQDLRHVDADMVERVTEMPVISNIVGRFIRRADYGTREQRQPTESAVERSDAGWNTDEKNAVENWKSMITGDVGFLDQLKSMITRDEIFQLDRATRTDPDNIPTLILTGMENVRRAVYPHNLLTDWETTGSGKEYLYQDKFNKRLGEIRDKVAYGLAQANRFPLADVLRPAASTTARAQILNDRFDLLRQNVMTDVDFANEIQQLVAYRPSLIDGSMRSADDTLVGLLKPEAYQTLLFAVQDLVSERALKFEERGNLQEFSDIDPLEEEALGRPSRSNRPFEIGQRQEWAKELIPDYRATEETVLRRDVVGQEDVEKVRALRRAAIERRRRLGIDEREPGR